MTSHLDKLIARSPELAPAGSFLRAILSALDSVEVEFPEGVPDIAGARARLDARIPALSGEMLIDGGTIIHNVRIIGTALENADEQVVAIIRALPALEGSPEAELVAEAAQSGGWDGVSEAARRLDVDEHAFITLLDYAARPALRLGAAMLKDVLTEAHWERGTCPACGAPPVLAELRGSEKERMLRCGRCASAWLYPRVKCVACGENDHRRLGYLHGEGEEEFQRADTCDVCKRYVKSVAVLDPLSSDELLEEDLATVGLDWIAMERGYKR